MMMTMMMPTPINLRKIRQYIDYVGELHLDLIAKFNAFPIIIPRIKHVQPLLDTMLPLIDGLLLTEGEDISSDFPHHHEGKDPSLMMATADENKGDHNGTGRCNGTSVQSVYERTSSPIDLETISRAHPSDTASDASKDMIEADVVKYCLLHGVPILAICRGSQLLNVLCGGTLHQDISTCLQLSSLSSLSLTSTAMTDVKVKHINYDAYDSHRHSISIVPHTPLARWFDDAAQVDVSSYHHQGVASLAPRFEAMAYAPDGLIEAFYDPRHPFVVGLQFHPERMQDLDAVLNKKDDGCSNGDIEALFEHEGCVRPYAEFVQACRSFCDGRWRRSARRRRGNAVGQQKKRNCGESGEENNEMLAWTSEERSVLMRVGATVRAGRSSEDGEVRDRRHVLTQATGRLANNGWGCNDDFGRAM